MEDDPGLSLGALGEQLGTRGCRRPEEQGKSTGNPIFTSLSVPFRASYHTSCPQSSRNRDAASPVPSERSGGSEDSPGGTPALGPPRTGP